MRPEFLLRLWRYKSITYLLTYCIQVAGLRVVKTRHVAERQNALVYFTTLQASNRDCRVRNVNDINSFVVV